MDSKQTLTQAYQMHHESPTPSFLYQQTPMRHPNWHLVADVVNTFSRTYRLVDFVGCCYCWFLLFFLSVVCYFLVLHFLLSNHAKMHHSIPHYITTPHYTAPHDTIKNTTSLYQTTLLHTTYSISYHTTSHHTITHHTISHHFNHTTSSARQCRTRFEKTILVRESGKNVNDVNALRNKIKRSNKGIYKVL